MKKAKNIFETNPVKFIAFCIGIVEVFLIYPAFIVDTGNGHEFSMHLFVELLVLTLTILLIQPVLDKRKESGWRAGKESGIKDLILLSNMATSYMMSPLGMRIFDFVHNPEELSDEGKDGIISMLNAVQDKNISSTLYSLNKSGWENFRNNILVLRQKIDNTVLIYKDHMPNELLSSLLILRNRFGTIDSSMGLFIGCFLYTASDWPERLTSRKSLFQNFCKDFDKDMKEYFSVLKDFIILREKYEE